MSEGHCAECAGRAEKLGLAINLVSTVREKVWYCSKKGYRPWERPTQKDVKTNDQGGHTIWYDEPQLLEVRSCPLLPSKLKTLISSLPGPFCQCMPLKEGPIVV